MLKRKGNPRIFGLGLGNFGSTGYGPGPYSGLNYNNYGGLGTPGFGKGQLGLFRRGTS